MDKEKMKNEQPEKETETGGDYAYKTVLRGKQNSRTLSVGALAVSILSVLLFAYSWVAIILGVAAVVMAVLSRKNIGYFDNLSLVALIVAIFGMVFGVTGLIFEYLVENTDYFENFMKEYGKYFGKTGSDINIARIYADINSV